MKKLILLLCINLIFTLSEKEIQDFYKFYKPKDFSNMDMFDSESRFSFHRYNQSEHFFIFWEKGFGEDPNSESLPKNLRVDIEDLLDKLELFYNTNIEYAKFAILGEEKTYLDIYKMEVFFYIKRSGLQVEQDMMMLLELFILIQLLYNQSVLFLLMKLVLLSNIKYIVIKFIKN